MKPRTPGITCRPAPLLKFKDRRVGVRVHAVVSWRRPRSRVLRVSRLVIDDHDKIDITLGLRPRREVRNALEKRSGRKAAVGSDPTLSLDT
jgi:hypothetical protein